MRQPANICRIYNTILSNMGKKVVVRTNHGRNKVDVAEGGNSPLKDALSSQKTERVPKSRCRLNKCLPTIWTLAS